MRNLIKALAKMRAVIQKGDAVYVHCKAGRSRSATIVFLYLHLYGAPPELEPRSPLSDVHRYLKSKRQEISLHEHHYHAFYEAMKWIDKDPSLLEPELAYHQALDLSGLSLVEQVHAYLATHKAKFDIAQLCGFKQLKEIALKDVGIKQHIQPFLNDILEAHNGAWLVSLYKKQGLPQSVIYFRDEVTKLLSEQLNQEMEAILIQLGCPASQDNTMQYQTSGLRI